MNKTDCVNEQGLNADTGGNHDECAPLSSQVSADSTLLHRNDSRAEVPNEATRTSGMTGCGTGGASAGDG